MSKSTPNEQIHRDFSHEDIHPPDLRSQLAGKKFHEKVDFILHRPIVEYCVIFLIIADSLIVVASLLIEIKLIEVSAEERTTTEKPAAEHATESKSTGHTLEEIAEILHITSLVILTLFLIEVFLKLYGQRELFFKRKLQVFDSFVVAVSFALDVVVIAIRSIDQTVISGISLIIILRLWRIIRIVNGAVVATKTELEEKIHSYKNAANEAREELAGVKEMLDEKEREIDFLKTRLKKYEPIEMLPSGSTRLPPYLPDTKKFPKQVLGDATDDEDYNISAFTDINARPSLPGSGAHGTAFQTYQAGVTYQPTSQYPADQKKSYSSSAFPASSSKYRVPSPANYLDATYDTTNQPSLLANRSLSHHDNNVVDTADESDVVSIKPSKSRSGNTFTVKKDGVPMTSL